MEEKVQDLLNECIGIVCELPVNNPKLVEEATGSKISADNLGAGVISEEDIDHAKTLVPTLRWLLDIDDSKKARKKRVATKPAQKPDKDNGAPAGGVRKKKGSEKKDPPANETPDKGDDLSV